MGVLKAFPETFIVQELVGSPPRAVEFQNESLVLGWKGDKITLFIMSKRRMESKEAIEEVARQLDVSIYDISDHGRKDKHAVTSQHIGVRGNFLPTFSHPDISLVQLDGHDRPLKHDGHSGNRFNILIFSAAEKEELDLSVIRDNPFVNFFGKQRVGRREGQEQVGRLFLEGKTKEATRLFLATNRRANPNLEDTLKLEIQKWQSYLWNKLAKEKAAKLGPGLPDMLPMWGTHQEVFAMYKHLWNPSRLNENLLYLLDGSNRPTLARTKNFSDEQEAAVGWRFKFDLPRGAFATVALEELFDLVEEDHRYSD
jgi:tRNA(Glu) U13 pseudouridine synthase TruD